MDGIGASEDSSFSGAGVVGVGGIDGVVPIFLFLFIRFWIAAARTADPLTAVPSVGLGGRVLRGVEIPVVFWPVPSLRGN